MEKPEDRCFLFFKSFLSLILLIVLLYCGSFLFYNIREMLKRGAMVANFRLL